MKILVLGATGRTGGHVVQQALADGEDVVAYVRSAARMPDLPGSPAHGGLTVVEGQLSDVERLTGAMGGTDAVISALGGTSGSPGALPSDHLAEILTAMRAAGVERYVGISSGAAVDVPGDRKPLPARLVGRLLRRRNPAAVADKRRELAALEATDDIRWTLARPTRLLGDGRHDGVTAHAHRPRRLWVSRADVAAFLLSAARSGTWVRQAPFVS